MNVHNPHIRRHPDILDKDFAVFGKVKEIFEACESDAIKELDKLEDPAVPKSDLKKQMQDMRSDVVNFHLEQIEEAMGLHEMMLPHGDRGDFGNGR